jgi:RHS repeat-associated protein
MNIRTLSVCRRALAALGIVLTIECGTHTVAEAAPTSGATATEQLSGALFSGDRLYWVGAAAPPESESEALLAAIFSANTNRWPDGLSSLESFIASYPQSAWTPSVQTLLAWAYYDAGRYTLALNNWETVWSATKSFKSAKGKRVADFTLTQWAQLLARLGRYETLVGLMEENRNRDLDRTVLSEWLRIREAVAIMKRNPGASYQCGTFALFNAASALNMKQQASPLRQVPSPAEGFSLKTLNELSVAYNLGFVAVKREAGAELVVPSVVHWKQNHYAAIVSRSGELYDVLDPTFGHKRSLSAQVINAEASGFFLVHADQIPAGYRIVSADEAATVFGRGRGEYFVDYHDKPCCPPDSCPPGSDGPNGSGGGGGGCGSCRIGMATWRVSEPYMSLWLEDEPLGYQPALGPRLSFQLRYKQRSDGIPVVGVGPSVACSWISVVDAKMFFSYHVDTFTMFYGQGGQETYYNASAIATNYYDYFKLQSFTNSSGSLTNVELLYPDGSIDNYGLMPSYFGGQRYCYLTSKISKEGYVTSFLYDTSDPANVKPVYVVDPCGATNYISYLTNSSSTVLISQVTDAYGRSTTLGYDDVDELTNITDVVGLTSSMVFDRTVGSTSYGWVTNLTTPYGITSFVPFDAGSGTLDRQVTITQPDGGVQLYAFFLSPPPYETLSYSASQVPTNDPINTLETTPSEIFSYHWGSRQYALLSTNNLSYFSPTDYLRARMRHWLGQTVEGSARSMDTLSIERDPSPDGVTTGQLTWYDYTGKSGAAPNDDQGYHITPDYVGRVLPDGSSRSSFYQRNSWWIPTNIVTSYTLSGSGVGTRTNVDVYASNDQDLLKSYGPDGALLRRYGYNAAHQLTAFTNAIGDWMTNTYNANHQLVRTRSLTGLTTTNIYFTSGSAINWLQQTIDLDINRTNSYTYSNALVQTHTDERGMSVTNTWDNLQRMLTAADARGATTYTYRYLDMVRVVDPMSFTTSFGYDSMGRKTSATNALGRATLYNYCNCGSLDSIQDAAGNLTHFYYDNAGRLTSTSYADGYSLTNKLNLLSQITNTIDSAGSSTTNWFNNQGLVSAVSNAFGQVKGQIFDSYDRATTVVDANAVTVTMTYDNLRRPLTRTYPDTGVERFGYSAAGVTAYTNQLGLTNFFTYDAAGRKTWETNANLEKTQFQYNPAGDLTNLVDGALHATSWKFDIYGRLTNKVDNLGNNLFFYGYDADNRLTNRNSAAKGTTTYRYDPVGNLTNVVYPVNAALVLSYDVLNRLTNMVDALGVTRYTYDAAGQMLSEGGLWTDDTVSFTYNNRLRTGLSMLQPDSSAWSQTYGYDGARRLTSVASPAGSFSYSYDATRHQLVNKLLLPNGAYITNTFDNVARMLSTALKNSGNTALNSHTYGYNVGNQRIALTNFAGDYRQYTYDKIGQLKTALGSESGGTARLLEQMGYSYDAADNLSYRTNNALVDTFNVNTLNELSTVTHSGTLTVAGTTTTNATTVTVNGSAANRYNDATFALGGFTVVNGNNTFTAGAQDALGRVDTNTITVNLPTTVTCVYDLNGNLTSDGTRGFDYDDENQLIRITVTNSWKTEFAYDGKLRRRQRIECTWSGSAWLTNTVTKYVYDGNLAIQERDTNGLPAVTYTRGNDLSGSIQGAGGIGGLLARTDAGLLTVGSPSAHAFYHADANGNITALINTMQALVAKYLYDPFGNILSQSGSLADANLYGFSSKELHKNSGLIYYLYRYYEPTFQRWLNRDPVWLGEFLPEGPNLFAFSANDAVNSYDALGLTALPTGSTSGSAGPNGFPSGPPSFCKVNCPHLDSQWPKNFVQAGKELPYPILPGKAVCIQANRVCLDGCEAEYGAASSNDNTDGQNKACLTECRKDCARNFGTCLGKGKGK